MVMVTGQWRWTIDYSSGNIPLNTSLLGERMGGGGITFIFLCGGDAEFTVDEYFIFGMEQRIMRLVVV